MAEKSGKGSISNLSTKVLTNIYRTAAEHAQAPMDDELTEVAALTKALKLPPVSDCNDGEKANDCVTIKNDALFRRIKDKRVIGETIKAKLRTMKRLVELNKVVPKMVARIKGRAMEQPLCDLLSIPLDELAVLFDCMTALADFFRVLID